MKDVGGSVDGATGVRRAGLPRRVRVAIWLASVALLCGLFIWATSDFPVLPAGSVSPAEHQVNLLALADWGHDTHAQEQVARAMAKYVRTRGRSFDAVLLAGDNYYMPLGGISDPRWERLFERMFDREALPMPFYAVFGNHDYDDDRGKIELEYARAHPESRWKMPAKWYRVDLPADAPLVRVLMLDSNYTELGKAEWEAQLSWLEGELASPRDAPWLLLCAHHPLFSDGEHGDDARLQKDWGELMRRHGVDVYVSGHDHNLQHLAAAGYATSFIVSGGGGANTTKLMRFDRGPFAREMHGFVHLRLGRSSADVTFVGSDGRPVYSFIRTPIRPRQNVPDPKALESRP